MRLPSYCFIVVGVWLDQNRLIQFNGDLTGRIVAINSDAWSVAQLREVINKVAAAGLPDSVVPKQTALKFDPKEPVK